MNWRISFICLIGMLSSRMSAQPDPTPATLRLDGFGQREALRQQSMFGRLEPASIGPSIFSCRVTDVEADPSDPSHFYVAYASGGLWYTESNGTRFTPVFDHQASMTIGDIAVDWAHHVLWIGTGEANSSRSSYSGTGIYRSEDGGKHWEWRGLPESHHIGRILLHPSNPDVLWVAVLGHLYSPNPERGVYKSEDGGKTWKRTLFVDENTGAVDLVRDPVEPHTLYAATWQRTRHAWNFDGCGPGSGIWKSVDDGESWTRVNTPESGFPNGIKTGRIGLAAGRKNNKTILYASIDNQNPKPSKPKKEDGLTKEQLKGISIADFLKLPEDKLKDFLHVNNFPEKYTVKKIREMVERGKIKPVTLVEYLEDANSNLFDTDYIGAEVYKSEDGGITWKKAHEGPLDVLFFTYGYYFSNIRCAADNPDQVYLLGFYITRSDDGGKTWKNITGENVHLDHHALWLNPSRPGNLLNGNDGGLNISWDNGDSWIKCNNPPVGQFYGITTDNADPFHVYGGAQDNGVWYGPSDYVASDAWHQNGQYPYKELMSGDGMQVAVDTRDNNTVYTGFQFGNYFRVNKKTNKQDFITPKHDLGERPLRFNWETPIWLSRHNQDVLYIGAQKLYRSFDQGENWEAISEDLTNGGEKGNVPYGTLTAIHESPLKFGLIYTGSDDGLIFVTRDGGENWNRISDSLPQKRWVSRVIASGHVKSRVYASLNGYRFDDFSSYLYVSEDYGRHWSHLGMNLPAEPINVVREDPVNPDVLYVGTDHGLYASLDRGASFQTIGTDFPQVSVHDLSMHAKTNELIVGTHGRSLFKVDVSELQQMNADLLAENIHIFDIQSVKYSRSWGKKQAWEEIKGPDLPLAFYAKEPGKANWTVTAKNGLVLNKGTIDCVKGLNNFTFGLDVTEDVVRKYEKELNESHKDLKKPIELQLADSKKYYLYKGLYLFELEKDGTKSSQEFKID